MPSTPTTRSPRLTRSNSSRSKARTTDVNLENVVMPVSRSFKSELARPAKHPSPLIPQRAASRKRPVPITPSRMDQDEDHHQSSRKKIKTSSVATPTRSSKRILEQEVTASEDELALKPRTTRMRAQSTATAPGLVLKTPCQLGSSRPTDSNDNVSGKLALQPGSLNPCPSARGHQSSPFIPPTDQVPYKRLASSSAQRRATRSPQLNHQTIIDDRRKSLRGSDFQSESCLSDLDARCLSAVEELLSGGIDKDEDEDEDENSMVILTSLAPSSHKRTSSPSPGTPTARATRSSDKLKTAASPVSTRANGKILAHEQHCAPVRSPLPRVASFETPSRRKIDVSRAIPPPDPVPVGDKTGSKLVPALTSRPAGDKVLPTAAGAEQNNTVRQASASRKAQKNKKGVFSKAATLPCLQKLLSHLSGTSPLAVRIPRQETDRHRILSETDYLVGLEEVESELRMLLDRSIGEAEGNVLLLCGARGSGKSAVITRSLGLLADQKLYGPNGFITINLNGLVQTNDRLALRELSRQLLKSLDRPPSRDVLQGEEEVEQISGAQFTTHANTLKHLLALLEPNDSRNEVSKPLVIILEEFDKFAELDRQAFLYTLLDIVQGSKRRGGICVVGTTAVVDCLDRLEKRVKSRCQSRLQYVIGPKNKPERLELVRSLLVLDHPIDLDEEEEGREFRELWNHSVEGFVQEKVVGDWLDRIFDLLSEGVPKVLQDLNRLVSRMVHGINKTGSLNSPFFGPQATESVTMSKVTKNHQTHEQFWWSKDLGTLELTILISAKHLSTIYVNGVFNLEMCWDAYRKHLKRNSEIGDHHDQDCNGKAKENYGLIVNPRSQVYGRDAFEMGWERLCDAELILSTSSNNSHHPSGLIGKRFEFCKLLPFIGQIDKVVDSRVDVARHLKKWCKNWSD